MLELRRDLARVCRGDIISVLPPHEPLLAGAESILINLKPSLPAFRQPRGTPMPRREPGGVSALGDALPAPVHPRAVLPLPATRGSRVPSGRSAAPQLSPAFTSLSPFLIGMLGLLHSGSGRSSSFLQLACRQMSSLQAVPRCTSSAV